MEPDLSPAIADVTGLLLRLGREMHSLQVPADVIEDLLVPAAERFGCRADFLLLQSDLVAEVSRGSSRYVELKRIDFEPHWRLARFSAVVDLARALAAGSVGVAEASDRLKEIASRPALFTPMAVVGGYAVYSAAVAARIGGGWLEMFAAGAVGVLGGAIHLATGKRRRIDLQQSFLAGALGSLALLVLGRVLPPFHFARALFGGMVLMVPAMVLTIAIHELANDALESGTVRLADGLLRFMMIAAGITAAIKLWELGFPAPTAVASAALPKGLVLAALVAGGLALVICLQARPGDAGWIVAAVLIAYVSQEITKRFIPPDGSPFIAAFVLGVVAYLQGRLPGHHAATMLIPGFLQIAPGFLGTESIIRMLQGKAGGEQTFFHVFLVALQLVTGLLVASVVAHRRERPRPAAPSRLKRAAA